MAADVLRSMLRLCETGDTVDEEVVHRSIDGGLRRGPGEIFKAAMWITSDPPQYPHQMQDAGTEELYKIPAGQRRDHSHWPLPNGKDGLAVAQAAQELKQGVVERIIMSRPAIEGEETAGLFCLGDLAQKVDPYSRRFMTRCLRSLSGKGGEM